MGVGHAFFNELKGGHNFLDELKGEVVSILFFHFQKWFYVSNHVFPY